MPGGAARGALEDDAAVTDRDHARPRHGDVVQVGRRRLRRERRYAPRDAAVGCHEKGAARARDDTLALVRVAERDAIQVRIEAAGRGRAQRPGAAAVHADRDSASGARHSCERRSRGGDVVDCDVVGPGGLDEPPYRRRGVRGRACGAEEHHCGQGGRQNEARAGAQADSCTFVWSHGHVGPSR